MDKRKIKNITVSALSFLIAFALFFAVSRLSGNDFYELPKKTEKETQQSYSLDLASLPDFRNEAYAIIDGNTPSFSKSDITDKAYEKYGELDKLGRCTQCTACIGRELMPTGERESISAVKPTGWQSARYSFIDGGNLYNRCHLIAFQLTGENANPNNLITGTRYMNVEGMLPFEEKVGNYVRSTGNHVMYRVTPIFKDNELVARGVHMEAISIEDGGKDICFNVYCYNNQPRIVINYKNGDSRKINENSNEKISTYIINTNNKRFHRPDCSAVSEMSEKNKKTFTGNRSDLIDSGYEPCGACSP